MLDQKVIADPRAEYIAGLRMLADILEANPGLNLPWAGGSSVHPICSSAVSRDELVAWARVLPGRKDKQVRDTYLDLKATLRGLHVKVIGDRDDVCQKVVVGTREVTEEVPDPDAPKVTVTKVVEDVEWRCGSLLADDREPAEVVAR